MAKNEIRHFLVPADFDEYNLDDLEQETKENHHVCWSNRMNQVFNVGDEVFIYFHDKKELTNKIMLKATICESDTDNNGNCKESKDGLFKEYCIELLKNKEAQASMGIEERKRIEEDANSTKKISGFYLGDFQALNEEKQEEFKFIKNEGIKGIRINQTKTCLDDPKNKKYQNLLNALTPEKEIFSKRNLKQLIVKYKKSPCVLCTEKEKEIHSFRKPNDLFYYEIHHILQQNLNNLIGKGRAPKWYSKNKYGEKEDNKLIYNEFNEVKLCPYHHNILHYGKIEKRRELLEQLVNDYYKEKLLALVGNIKDYENIIKYIYNQYNVSYDK